MPLGVGAIRTLVTWLDGSPWTGYRGLSSFEPAIGEFLRAYAPPEEQILQHRCTRDKVLNSTVTNRNRLHCYFPSVLNCPISTAPIGALECDEKSRFTELRISRALDRGKTASTGCLTTRTSRASPNIKSQIAERRCSTRWLNAEFRETCFPAAASQRAFATGAPRAGLKWSHLIRLGAAHAVGANQVCSKILIIDPYIGVTVAFSAHPSLGEFRVP